MARITVEDCLTKENNRFALVLLASKRTKQLLQGARSASVDQRGNKPVVTALREIAEGKVRFMTEEEARIAKELEEQKRAEAAQQAQGQQNGSSLPDIDRLFAEVAAAPAEASDEAETEAADDAAEKGEEGEPDLDDDSDDADDDDEEADAGKKPEDGKEPGAGE